MLGRLKEEEEEEEEGEGRTNEWESIDIAFFVDTVESSSMTKT